MEDSIALANSPKSNDGYPSSAAKGFKKKKITLKFLIFKKFGLKILKIRQYFCTLPRGSIKGELSVLKLPLLIFWWWKSYKICQKREKRILSTPSLINIWRFLDFIERILRSNEISFILQFYGKWDHLIWWFHICNSIFSFIMYTRNIFQQYLRTLLS